MRHIDQPTAADPQMNTMQYKILGLLMIGTLVTFASWRTRPSQSTPTEPASPTESLETSHHVPVYDEPLVTPLVIEALNGQKAPGIPSALTETHRTPVDATASLLRLTTDRFKHDERATFHPHGESVCASGCASSRHPTPKLTPSRYRQLLKRYALQTTTTSVAAMEELLFHGPQTVDCLNKFGCFDLSHELTDQLRKQLRLTHARIAIRVTDEHGRRRAVLEPTRVPLDRRHVFRMQTDGLQPMVASGTAKRVGSDRVWTRL